MARMHWKKVGVESELRRKDMELKCDECHKYFFGKYLAFHKSVVHGEDAFAYKCKATGCVKSCLNLSELADHRRVAHGHAKLRCKIEDCGSEFLLYSELVGHCQTHQVKTKCDECGKMLSPNYIKSHKIRMHRREISMGCPTNWLWQKI